MTNINKPTTDHLREFKKGWNKAAEKEGKLNIKGDTWHMIGRKCQIQFGKFVSEKETEDMQYRLFMFIVNQRRTEANLGRNVSKDELKNLPKGTHSKN